MAELELEDLITGNKHYKRGSLSRFQTRNKVD